MSRWIAEWDAENEAFWKAKGERIAWRNLSCVGLTWWCYLRRTSVASGVPTIEGA